MSVKPRIVWIGCGDPTLLSALGLVCPPDIVNKEDHNVEDNE